MLSREMDGDTEARGGILADEMGLGKTIQTIATVLGNPQPNPTLLIVPKSLLSQWKEQIEQFCDMSVITITTKSSRAMGIDPETFPRTLSSFGNKFILMTYETACRIPNLHQAIFSRIVLDEAHRIKDDSRKTHRAICALQGTLKWALTGTPITRVPSDFANLMKFVGLHRISRTDLDSLKEVYLLRRTFEDLSKVCPRLALPPLEIVNHTLELSQKEKDMYNSMIKYGQFCVRTNEMMRLEGDDRRAVNRELLEVLLRLQQIVVSPTIAMKALGEIHDSIFNHAQAVAEAQKPIGEDNMCSICISELQTPCKTRCGHWFCEACITNAVRYKRATTGVLECPYCRQTIDDKSIQVLEGARIEGESIYNETSTKIQKIMEILDGMRDEKVIIFTHWKKEMEELRHVIDGMGLPCMSIDGSVSVENRKATCDDFNSRQGGCVLLSQIQVGGCGLNLQACQTVILPSLDWSPSVEMQAIARAHRIGVNHPVKVHRIIAKGSIDEHVLRIQSEKLNYSSDLFNDPRINKKLGFDTSNTRNFAAIFALLT